MYHNWTVPEARYRYETTPERVTPGAPAETGQSVKRTAAGAAVLSAVPIAVVVAASYPAVAAVVAAIAVGAVGIARKRGDDPTTRTEQEIASGDADRDRSIATSN